MIAHHRLVIGCIAGIAMLAGCSGTGAVSPVTHPVVHQQAAIADAPISGVVRSAMPYRTQIQTHIRYPGAVQLLGLYLGEAQSNEILVLQNKTWGVLGSITAGLNGPDGMWVDGSANVYTANYRGADISEYSKALAQETWDYITGLTDPIVVTTDSSGDVFAGDINNGANGHVSEFPQKSNTPLVTCGFKGAVEGVAVSSTGAVFVGQNLPLKRVIIGFEHGLIGCKESFSRTLPIQYEGEMILDKQNNLIITDQLAGTIDILKPPYKTISASWGGFTLPFGLGLNDAETRLFVTEPGQTVPDVKVLAYPSGTLITTLSSSNGVDYTLGISDYPNAVF